MTKQWGTPLERFQEKITQLPEGCWQWVGGKKAAGYGQFFVDGRKIIAHRWSYQNFVGPIPDGYEVDHLCRNRSCVNPEHLEAITLEENRRRRVEAKTHCVNGHEYTPENTYRYLEQGYWQRHCRACGRDNANRRYARKQAAQLPSSPGS